ncbi:MAG: sodium:solute symporter family protein [Planctomycetia bacterium]|nr:sodium:solute symporter family protein [Planctomycetia bacterium]
MTHFSWPIDGTIIGLYLVATMVAGIMMRKYVGKVEHFLVAGREVNVYLGIASLAATEFGVVTCMYTAQNGYQYGFAGATPGVLMALAMVFVGATGFCINPLRRAGVMTIPELFEKRFGPRVRWAAGVVIVLGGLLNMGVFLRITGEFLVLVGGFDLDHLGRNVVLMMTALLALGTIYTVAGGMLSVLVTDFLQFIVMSAGLIAVTILILMNIGWEKLAATVADRYADGGFNPFFNPGLGWQYVLFNALECLAGALTWQTMISRLLSAKDAKTGRQIYTRTSFFFVARFLLPGIWGIAALAWLAPDAMSALPRTVQEQSDSLYAMPLFLSKFVPVGLMGLLLAAMLAADMSNTSSYMITWASVIYNDVLAPLRKTPWSEKRGLLWNRAIVSLIGVFLLFYGLLYPLKGDVYAYLLVTGTIYMSSISIMLIACCYWKRANNWGAAAAIVVGAVIPIACLVIEQFRDMPPNDVQLWRCYTGIAAYAATAVAMIVGSLLKPGDNSYDLEKP